MMNESEKALRMTMQRSIQQILSERKHRRLSDAELYAERFGMFEQEYLRDIEVEDVYTLKEEVQKAAAQAKQIAEQTQVMRSDLSVSSKHKPIGEGLQHLHQTMERWVHALNLTILDIVQTSTFLPISPFCIRLHGHELAMHDLLPSNELREVPLARDAEENTWMHQNRYASTPSCTLLPWDTALSIAENLDIQLRDINSVQYKIGIRLASLNMSNRKLAEVLEEHVPQIEDRYEILEPWLSKVKAVSTHEVFMTELRKNGHSTEFFFFGKVHRHWVYLFSMTQTSNPIEEHLDALNVALKESIARNQDLFLEQFFTFHFKKTFGKMNVIHTFPQRRADRRLTIRYEKPRGVYGFGHQYQENSRISPRMEVLVPFDMTPEETRAAKHLCHLLNQVELYPRHIPFLNHLTFSTDEHGIAHAKDFVTEDSRLRFQLNAWMSEQAFEDVLIYWDTEQLILSDLRRGCYREALKDLSQPEPDKHTLNQLPRSFHVKHTFESLEGKTVARVYYNSGLNRQYDWFAFEEGKQISRSRYFRLKNRKKRWDATYE